MYEKHFFGSSSPDFTLSAQYLFSLRIDVPLLRGTHVVYFFLVILFRLSFFSSLWMCLQRLFLIAQEVRIFKSESAPFVMASL